MPDHLQAFRDAIAAAGLTPPDDLIDDGKRHRFATSNRRGDAAGWYILHGDDIPAGAFGDWRSGFSQSWCSRERESLTQAEREAMRQRAAAIQAQRDEARRAAWDAATVRNRDLWGACQRLSEDDTVHQYLSGRGLDLAALPGGPPACLRLHPALPYYEGGDLLATFPAMVSAIVSPAGRCIGLHRTYLAHGPGGRVIKASVPNAKKMTRMSATMAGASIPLAMPGIDGTLGIAEGIETALACTLGAGVPTVAAVSAGGLARWQWPNGLRELFIFADNDASGTGQKAASDLASRARAAGIRCMTLTPTDTGTDWADAWARREAVTVTTTHESTP